MPKKLKPEDFVGCNLIDKTYLDDEGYLISSDVTNKRETEKIFDKYIIVYFHSKRKPDLMFYIYENGKSISSISYYHKDKPYFQFWRDGLTSITEDMCSREIFLEKMMPLDKCLAFWLLWNI